MLSILLLLLITTTSSKPLKSCTTQSSCLSVSYAYKSDTVNICIKYDNSLPNCKKDGSISHACFNSIESDKIEGFNSGDEMCIEALCNKPIESRWVEFGFKDGPGCADKSETAVTIQGAFGNVQCRAANAATNDVLCGGGAKKECIHKIYYDQCPTQTTTNVPVTTSIETTTLTPTTTIDVPETTIDDVETTMDDAAVTTTSAPVSTTSVASTTDIPGIPKCNDQAPCLQIDYDDSWGDGLVSVCVTFDTTKTLCMKNTTPLNDMCYPNNSGDIIQESLIISGTQKCVLANCMQQQFVEFAFNDGEGCDGENTFVSIDGAIQPIQCKSAIGTNFCPDIQNGKQCIYKIPVIGNGCGNLEIEMEKLNDAVLANDDGVPKNDRMQNNNKLIGSNDGMNNGVVIGIVGIIIGCVSVICIGCIIYWIIYIFKKNKNQRNVMRKEMEVIGCDTKEGVMSPISVTNASTVSIVSTPGTQETDTNILMDEEYID